MLSRKHKQKGFTFIEVIIALAVLVFGIYGALDLYFNAQRLGERASFKTQALYLAKGKMVELQAAGAKVLFAQFEKAGGNFLTEPASLSDNPDFEYQWGLNQEELAKDILRLEVSVVRKNFPDSAVKLTAHIFAEEE